MLRKTFFTSLLSTLGLSFLVKGQDKKPEAIPLYFEVAFTQEQVDEIRETVKPDLIMYYNDTKRVAELYIENDRFDVVK